MKYVYFFSLLFTSLFYHSQNNRTKIYSKIINNYDYTKIIAITDSTSIGHLEFDEEYLNYIKYSLPKLQKETLQSFIENNKNQIKLTKNDFTTEKKLILLSTIEHDKIFKEGNGWLEFYQKYGKTQGILTVSLLGYNNDFTQALIYRGNQLDWKAGSGYLILFEKINEDWEISEYIQIWIS